jgi:hypothetical protein
MTTLLAKPTKDDRLDTFKRADWPQRVAMHERIAACKAQALDKRRELGCRYLDRHPGGYAVPYETAVGSLDLVAETAAARAESIALAAERASQYNNGSLEFPVLAQDFPVDGPSIALGMAPQILAPIVRYFGMLPVLFNMFVTRAHSMEMLENSAHRFHLDPEDTISFKAFVHLTDVDDDCGPFHALHADATQTVVKAENYGGGVGKISDERVAELVGWDKVAKFLGPPGTVALADTTRCLHFGGRPRKEGKPVRDMLVFQYLIPTSLLFPIDGDAKHPRFIPQLEPTGDDHWDALIGARFT